MTGAPPPPGVQVEIRTHDDAAAARAAARAIGVQAGLAPERVEALAICASELSHNIAEHAGGSGRVTLTASSKGEVWLSAEDEGPGLDPAQAADRQRSHACDGLGLASVGRLADVVQIQISPGLGSRITARLTDHRLHPKVVTIVRTLAGESVSGDATLVFLDGERLRLGVVDGLGHGAAAGLAAEAAVEVLSRASPIDLGAAVQAAHERLRGTRGAALAVVELTPARCELVSTSVGNVSVLLERAPGTTWSATAVGAVVGFGRGASGGRLPTRLERTDWAPGARLALFSDGLSLRAVRAASLHDAPDQMAAAFAVFARAVSGTDDAALLVCG